MKEFTGRQVNEPDDDEIDIRALFGLLRRQIKLIFFTTLLVMGLAIAYLYSVTPIYTASSLILVDPGQKNLLNPQPGFNNSSTDNARVASEVEILKSDAVALSVVSGQSLISDPEFGPSIGLKEKLLTALGFETSNNIDGDVLLKRVVDRFKNNVSVARRGSTYLISVSVSSQTPKRAAELSNALASAYIQNQLESKIATSLAARDILQSQIDDARTALARSEAAFDDFIVSNMDRIARETGRKDIANLRDALEKIQQDTLNVEVLANLAERDLQAQDWGRLTERLQSQALDELQRQRGELERRLASAVSGTQADIDLNAALSRLDLEFQGTARVELSGLRSDVLSLQGQASDFQAQIRTSVLSSELPSELLAEIYEIQQEAAISRSQYQTLLSRLRDVEAQSGLQIADSRIVSAALVPTGSSYPNKKLILLISIVLGSGLGIGLAIANEFFIGGFTSENQLQNVLNLPVAATIPLTVDRSDARRSPAQNLIDAPLSIYSESIRRLRASVDRSLRSRNQNAAQSEEQGSVILVTSSIPEEGKSTTALSLARAYALSGKQTLLIDGDLRKPSLHAILGIEPDGGLLHFLKNPNDSNAAKEFYGTDEHSPLQFILGAQRSDIPTDQLLLSKSFDFLIGFCRKKFDVIIIDSPPLLPVVDAQYIAPHADAIILVVRWAMTSQSDLRSILPGLLASKTPSATIIPVMSQQQGRRAGYYYQGYYSDY